MQFTLTIELPDNSTIGDVALWVLRSKTPPSEGLAIGEKRVVLDGGLNNIGKWEVRDAPAAAEPVCNHTADLRRNERGYRFCVYCGQDVKVVDGKLVSA